jgi:osmotically-inducible protein OsmY
MKRRLPVVAIVLLGACGDPGPRTVEDRVDDHAIVSEVNRLLSRVDGLDRHRIRVSCTDGKVTLGGEVRDDATAARAVEAAGNARGAVSVEDRMQRPAR